MGGGQSSWVLASAEAWGTWGVGGLPGHMSCCPELHPTGNPPVSSPQARSWEAAHPRGKEEAAIQILIQILEAAGSKSFPVRPLCSLPRAALLLPRPAQQGLSVPRIRKLISHQVVLLWLFLPVILSPNMISQTTSSESPP